MSLCAPLKAYIPRQANLPPMNLEPYKVKKWKLLFYWLKASALSLTKAPSFAYLIHVLTPYEPL